jgi:hypothetical protein
MDNLEHEARQEALLLEMYGPKNLLTGPAPIGDVVLFLRYGFRRYILERRRNYGKLLAQAEAEGNLGDRFRIGVLRGVPE